MKEKYLKLFQLIVTGESVSGAAKKLKVSPRTTEQWADAVKKEYGAKTMVHLVYILTKKGIL